MFEKEAEYYAFDEVNHKQEWYIKHPEHSIDCDYEDIKKHWGKGAEFGYKEGIKTLDDMTRAFNREHKKYTDLRIANEWHYVKDELPELYKDVLVVFPQGDCDVKRLTNHNEWVGRGSWCSLTDVIAWKEIVLPNIKESE